MGFSKDGIFEYSKYQECTTGTYDFDDNPGTIEFFFDCDININGESVNYFIDKFHRGRYGNEFLTMDHHIFADPCEADCLSLLGRIESWHQHFSIIATN